AQGARVGELRWINVGALGPGARRQGNQLLDFADLDGERGKIFLGAFVANAPASAAHLKLSIDGPNAHAESNEQNNSVFLPKPKLADLRIAEFTMDPIAPRAGDRVWFTARVENVGNATTGQPTATGIIVDNDATSRKLVGQFTTAIVPAGKSVMVRWTKENYYGWVAVEGAHTIDVCADRAKVVGEADETNNCARKTVTVRAPEDETPKLPDLLVESAAVELGALRIAARNDGGTVSDATDIWLMWFGTKGALSSSAAVNLPAVAAGGTTIVVVEVPLDGNTEASRILRDPPKDATKLRVYADGSRKVKEVHEDNNDAYLDRAKFPTAPIENKPPTADAGEDITARDDDGDGKEDVRFYSRESKDPDGKIAKWTWTVAGREVATGQYPYWWKVPVGTHTVTLTVTDDKGASATDVVTVTVGAKPSTQPDLAFEAFTMTPTQPKPGDTVSFTARVANRSTISIGAVSTVSFDIWTDGKYRTQLAQPVVRDLAPGESQEFHWNDPNDRYYHWKPQAGSHRIIVCVDNTKLIAEADEKNNCAEVVVTVGVATPEPPSKPDLVPEALRVSPANARVGQMLTFSATVRNRGGSPASESVAWFLVDFDRDGETDLTSEPEEVPALAAGATKTVTWPQAIAAEPGSHTLEFCVDADEEVAEADEKNNCTKFPFTVSSTGTAPESSSLGSSFFSSLLGALFGATPIVAGGPEDVRR
ncbi:hypothetical protein HY480_00615, partial [Candidatus Uhrbacteria bacterium]|nr:hypothetical protein [Candidatus Uhrbacteria bacterium]